MLINDIFTFMLVDADDIPEGDAEDNNEYEDNAVPPVPVAANNTINIKLDADCYHHLRNVWINTLCVCLYKHAQQELSEDLKDVDRHLRVKIEMSSFMRALDKFFNKTSNHAKRDGDAFRACMEECHSDTILCNIKIIIGSI